MGSTTSSAELSTKFYSKTCPNLHSIMKSAFKCAVSKEKRVGASLIRLHFHDCFVNGCAASILLDDISSFKGEKTAGPNYKSVRGYNVIDYIKSKVEAACPGVVSCADIVAIAARDSTVILGGPTWDVKLRRRDSKTTSFSLANDSALPAFTSTLKELIYTFKCVGLSTKDMEFSPGGRFIISADRDFKIRVTLFPKKPLDGAHEIQRFCLGHSKFAQALSIEHGRLPHIAKHAWTLLRFTFAFSSPLSHRHFSYVLGYCDKYCILREGYVGSVFSLHFWLVTCQQ
ncbi:Peroxidase 4 [Camellia lanceoleosa]|uniref:Peroxidase 4 n=1 Tax=Camellia lanceoleosa TaxID=1840588 RepID=A0ACC0F231_9ERIC|nr:Peroxidase 4 [Camellia lanceoleosa]